MTVLFFLANLGVGAAFLWLAVGAVALLYRRARRNAHSAPLLSALIVLAGVGLIELGLARAVFGYRAFDAGKTALHMACTLEPGAEHDAPPQIRFDFDPTRQCQNRTFYAARGAGLERVILQTVGRRGRPAAYDMRVLAYRPSFAAPLRAGEFSRTTTRIDHDLYARLLAAGGDDAATCPDAGDADALSRARRAAEALRTAASGVQAPQTVSRWRCMEQH